MPTINDYIPQPSDLVTETPWGYYEVLAGSANFPRYKVKKLTIMPGEGTSLQRHMHRMETFTVISGTAKVQTGNETNYYANYGVLKLAPLEMHRLTNAGKIPLVIIEVQYGEYLEEDDIERFEDNYGRV